MAVPVAENLHFDVARIDHGLFHEHIGRAERLGGLGHDTLIAALQVVLAVAATDAASAAAAGGLEHHRITDFFGQFHGFRDVLKTSFAARHHRDAGGNHGLARMDLVAHGTDHLGRRADEGDAAPRADLGELRILGQKAITGMQGIATGGDREVHDTVGIEIAADRVGAQIIGLVGLFDVQGAAVGIGIDRHRLDVHFGAGAHNSHRDLAAVSDQYLAEHRCSVWLEADLKRQGLLGLGENVPG